MDKSPDAMRTISEAADELDLPQHVLRFWETRFTQIKPLKRNGGRRFYRPDDIELLRAIRYLLYAEGYTIKGVQKLLQEQGPRGLLSAVGMGRMPTEDLPQPVGGPAAVRRGDARLRAAARGERRPAAAPSHRRLYARPSNICASSCANANACSTRPAARRPPSPCARPHEPPHAVRAAALALRAAGRVSISAERRSVAQPG